MGRSPCCSKVGLHRGPWTAREDTLLIQYIQSHGEGHWRSLPKKAGLLRCGKSCRLRWMNYLRPDIKRGNITPDEDDLIVRLHSLLGNRWSLIAGRLPGRTDNEIKNYWNTHISKRLKNSNQDSTTHNRRASSKFVGEPKKNAQEEVTTKSKVHLPKPIRVSPLSITENNMVFGSYTQEAGSHDSEVSNLHDVSWYDEIKGGDGNDFGEALVCDNIKDCDDFVNQGYEGCGPSGACSNQNAKPEAAERDSTLPWKMYEECYQQLKAEDHVQLDSFVDSLLV